MTNSSQVVRQILILTSPPAIPKFVQHTAGQLIRATSAHICNQSLVLAIHALREIMFGPLAAPGETWLLAAHRASQVDVEVADALCDDFVPALGLDITEGEMVAPVDGTAVAVV